MLSPLFLDIPKDCGDDIRLRDVNWNTEEKGSRTKKNMRYLFLFAVLCINWSVATSGACCFPTGCQDSTPLTDCGTNSHFAGQPCVDVICPAACGNGVLEEAEECDDGNTDDGDGCSATCEWQCDGLCDPASDCQQCGGGCTFSAGYWRNHHVGRKSPNQKIRWPNVGGPPPGILGSDTSICVYIAEHDGSCAEDTCDISALDVLTTPTRGNQWIQLAKQYIAAVNNINKDNRGGPACTDAEVEAALQGAALLLKQNCVEVGVGVVKDGHDDFLAAVCFASLLADWNNGLLGPGHCSPDVELADVQVQNGEWTPNPGWWDIANFIMLILLIGLVIALIVWVCTRRSGPMGTNASLADVWYGKSK